MDKINNASRINKIDFYYFSGTGNTLLVVNHMADVFKDNGISVSIKRIEDTDPRTIDTENVIGLAFPVAEFSTYSFIWDFIHAMPRAAQTKIFMVDTLAGFSGGIVGPLKKVLKKKGYNTIGAKEIISPANIFYIYPQKINIRITQKALEAAREYARQILLGESKWGRIALLSDVVYFFYKNIISKIVLSNWNQKYFGLKVDKNKCVKCGLCARLCPVKNITMNNDFPVFDKKCSFCMRCVSFCPYNAIPAKYNIKGTRYTAAGINADSFLE